jgi:hypothetical protein
MILTGTTETIGERSLLMPLYPPQTTHVLVRAQVSADEMSAPWNTEKTTTREYCYIQCTRYGESIAWFEGCQAPAGCAGKSNRPIDTKKRLEYWGLKLAGEKRSIWTEICPSVILSTTNPTWTRLGSNRGSEERSRWLTTWAMARNVKLNVI